MFMALNVVFGVLVSQPSVPFVVRPAIYPGPVHSRAFAGVASSPVTWLVSVGQPRPSSSASVPSPSPSSSPADPVPDPVSTPSDPVPVTNPVPDDPSAPAPASVPSYPSITVDDHLRTRQVKRLELVTPEDGEVVMSSDLSVADASPQRRTRPRVPSSVDYKKLVRLFHPKVKLVQIRLLSKSCVYPWLKCIN